MPEPLILVTNDDGFYANGIYVLQQVVADIGETVVVAPETEKSAVGHAITISHPIRISELERENGFSGHAVAGTPADCVKLGIKVVLDRKPDLVVSGINRGSNVGMSILYSGTVSAATEAVILGVPAIAVSLDAWVTPDYSYAATVAKRFVKMVLENGIEPGVALNINVPKTPDGEAAGFRVTRQGTSNYEERFDQRIDPRQNVYYWMDGELVSHEDDPSVDDVALREGYVSVTPLRYNLTSEESFANLKTWKVFQNNVA
ncbi:MAG: 5'/3'-nucleotidase SurE [Candidatus Neomarinimicrobiota bacterium]|nr:5'/3'-nucleotidase SurE [Candidatus Neomarinimicrobiota bacterium]